MNQVAQDISVALKSDKGRRPENEDAGLALTSEDLGDIEGLYVVADGMGGRASGSTASKMAVDAVRSCFLSKTHTNDLASLLAECLQAANKAVYSEAQAKPDLQGMGTTCVAAAVRDGQVYFAHMGDSRIYLLHDGRLDILTEDHSFVAEQVRAGKITQEDARKSRFRNVITKAIGLEPDAQPTTGSTEFKPGDVLLLCSDGLSGPVKDEEIADILRNSSNPDEACNRLVDAALRNGGSDNVTALIASYGRPNKAKDGSSSGWLVPALIGVILGLVIGLFMGWQYWSPRPAIKEPPAKPDLFNPIYSDPVSLTYLPLNPSFLALDGLGILHAIDPQGRFAWLDVSGQVIRTSNPREAFKRLQMGGLAMAGDSRGNLYISMGNKIAKFNADGRPVTNIGEGKLESPGALAIGSDGTIFVIDNGRLKAIRPKTSVAGP